ncbi:MAG TPA: CocE/NonD family hydrolase [Acidimicrobiia bacterium]|nr:CocE/NonD family hydrolase [Acidimicrobiia bacterium]
MTDAQAAYDVIVEHDVVVPTRDGTGLSTDIYRPAQEGRLIDGPLPTLLSRTPYGKARWQAEGEFFARLGYAVALQDWRQTQHQFDTDQWRPKHEATDGYDAIEWLASRSWSNGKVGMWGHSAMGQAIQAVLPLQPPSLASVFIIDSGLNYGAGYARKNGTFTQAFRLRHSLAMARQLASDPQVKEILNDAYRNPDHYFSCFRRPHAPITRGTTVLSLSPFHEDRYLRVATTPDLDDDYWKDSGTSDEDLLLQWKDIPIYFVTGWYGNHLQANFDKFRSLDERLASPVKLVVGYWEHNMDSTSAGGVDFGRDSDIDVFWTERRRWFDETLRGAGRGMLDGPAVRYFVMGGGSGAKNSAGRLDHGGRWAESDTWPPPGSTEIRYHLHADGTLAESPSEEADSSTTFTFDPRDPVPTVGGTFMEYSRPDFKNRVTWMPDGAAQNQRANPDKPFSRDGLPLSTREDVLVFQTPPLEEAVEVTGDLVAHLWVSSTAPDTDFTVKLIDVHPPSAAYPEGFAMNLQDAIVRMRYRNGRRKADLIEPGKIYEVELRVNCTSNLFGRGHRIRVDVSSSNFPLYDVNLNTGGPLGVPGPVHTADNTLHHDREHPSHVVLPVTA